MKAQTSLSIGSNKEMLKRFKSNGKTKAAQSIGLVPMELNSQEQITAPINQTFTLFPNLPLELQRKVWEFAAVPIPRAIEIQSKFKENTNKYVISFYNKVFLFQPRCRFYTITSPVPTNLLHVCSESRNIALRNYSFRTFFRRPFYLNEDTDILWVRGPAIVGFPTRNGIITQCPREEGTSHLLVSKYKFRHLAIDYQAQHKPFPMWSNFFPGQRDRCWNTCFWYSYILEGPAFEKIYLVYTKQEEQKMAQEEAESMFELGKIFMAAREKHVQVFIPGVFICRATELRRRLGLGFKVPLIEAILDAELMQQFL